MTRKITEQIVITDKVNPPRFSPITITLVDVDRNKARIGVDAELEEVLILRAELTEEPKPE